MCEAGSVIRERGAEVFRDTASISECSLCKLKFYYSCRPTKSELRVV